MTERMFYESTVRTPDGITVNVTITADPDKANRADPGFGEVVAKAAQRVSESARLALSPPPF